MGNQSKKLLNELIPLIQICKEQEKRKSAPKLASHKKSNSISPYSIADQESHPYGLKDIEEMKKTPNKKIFHIHQKSMAPPAIKIDGLTFDSLVGKADDSQKKPQFPSFKKLEYQKEQIKKEGQKIKPIHRKTKSEVQKISLMEPSYQETAKILKHIFEKPNDEKMNKIKEETEPKPKKPKGHVKQLSMIPQNKQKRIKMQ